MQARQARADAGATKLAPVITELRAAGVTSLKGIAVAPSTSGAFPRRPAVVNGALHRSVECWRGCRGEELP